MKLQKLKRNQINLAVNLLVRAYKDNEFFKYSIPDLETRLFLLRAIFKVRIKFGLLYGEVFTTSDNIEGVAQWIKSDKSDYTFLRIIRVGAISLRLKLGKKLFNKLLEMGTECDEVPKRIIDGTFMSLLTVAIDPKYQGKGYASKLLKPMIVELDKKDIICALETPTEKNLSLYEHFGFKLIEEKLLKTSNNQVKMWFMLRKPL